MNLKHQQIINLFTKFGKEYLEIWFSGEKYEGEYKDWYKNGQICEHSFWKNGQPDGERKNWSFYGKLLEHSVWKDGNKVRDIK